MALTPEQIKKMDELTGLTSANTSSNRINELRSLGTTTTPEKKNIAEKIASFTGGEELGQGLGQAIVNKGISKSIDQAQEQQFAIQGQLLQKIRERKQAGEDTSKLENALKLISDDIETTGTGAKKLLNQDELTTKSVIGDALQLGTTLAGAGTLPGATKTVTGATTVGKGIIQGAKTGAIAGGAFGASSGVSNALQENKSAAEIAKAGVGGALVGAGTGGIVGGAVGGVSGGIRGAKLARQTKQTDFALDLVSPKQTEAVKIQALKEGRVTEQGLLSAGKILPSKRDVQLSEAVKGVISNKNSPTKNLSLIADKVDEINTGVKAYVKVNKTPFNGNQLRSQLNQGKDELNLVFASDKQAEKTYDAVVKEFMKHVKNKDTAGLLDARQSFDKIPAIKKLLDSQGLGENTRKEVALTVRSQANRYIASLLPEGNSFREALLRESKMIEAMGNIAEKNTNIIGANKLQLLTKKYPVLNWLAGGIGAGLVGGASIGVGRSIIGSTE